MSFWKSRADIQDRYRRELFTGTVAACNADGTYDVALPGIAEPVRGVANAGDVRFQEGNRVVLTRVGGRSGWQIHAGMAAGAPTRSTNPLALIDAPPLVYWDGLARAASQAETVAEYVDGKSWPLSALQQSAATDGQVPQWSADAGAWIPGDGAGGGLTAEALRSPVAAALAGLVAGNQRPLAMPPSVGGWLMVNGGETDVAYSVGAFVYASNRFESLRNGAYPVKPATLAYWKLDETSAADAALDCAGHLYDLTAHQMQSGEPSGFHWARQWDGWQSYLERTALPLETSNALAIELWLKPHALANNPLLFYQSGSASLQFESGGTRLRFYVITTGAVMAEAVVDPAVLGDGNWHYLAGVYDGSVVRLYVDGVATGTTPAQSGNVAQANSPSCYVGVYAPTWTGWSRYYDGFMDELRISQVGVTAEEIAVAWAGRDIHQAITSPLIAPTDWGRVMLGAVTQLNGGTAAFAVSADNGATWTDAVPWEWTPATTPGTHWRIRVTLTGRAEVKRLGMVGVP